MSGSRVSMDGLIHKAYKMLWHATHDAPEDSMAKYSDKIKDKKIQIGLIKLAKGLCFVTEVKTAMLLGVHGGTGIVIAKTPEGKWSAPSAVGTGGLSFGFAFGGSTTDSLIILNTDGFVDAFKGKAQFKLGGNLQVAAGPVGRNANAFLQMSQSGLAPAYSYSYSRGIYMGATFNTDAMMPRTKENCKFYGGEVTSENILTGLVQVPENENWTKFLNILNEICEGKYDSGPIPAPKDPAKDSKTAEATAAAAAITAQNLANKAAEDAKAAEAKEPTEPAGTGEAAALAGATEQLNKVQLDDKKSESYSDTAKHAATATAAAATSAVGSIGDWLGMGDKKDSKKEEKKEGEGDPPAHVWQEVRAEDGGTYWWNTTTNETTLVGAPKPTQTGNKAAA